MQVFESDAKDDFERKFEAEYVCLSDLPTDQRVRERGEPRECSPRFAHSLASLQ